MTLSEKKVFKKRFCGFSSSGRLCRGNNDDDDDHRGCGHAENRKDTQAWCHARNSLPAAGRQNSGHPQTHQAAEQRLHLAVDIQVSDKLWHGPLITELTRRF